MQGHCVNLAEEIVQCGRFGAEGADSRPRVVLSGGGQMRVMAASQAGTPSG